MSQEKILEKQKRIKKILEEEFIEKNKTLKQISKETNIPYGMLARYKTRFGFKKYNKKKPDIVDKIKKLYLEDNLTIIEISEKLKVNRGLVGDYIAKYNFKKSKEQKRIAHSERIKKISLEKFGVSHFNSSEEIIKKRKKTCLEKYNSESYLGSEHHRDKYNKKLIFNDKSPYQIGLEYGISNIILYRWLKKNPEATEKEFLDFVNNYKINNSVLENIFIQTFSIEHFNKYPDPIKYPDLKYRPDFKLNDSIFINVDGLYWHSEKIKTDKTYHFKMRECFEKYDLKIFQFRADEIRDKLEIVKSIINHKLNLSNKIYARKTKIKKINQSEANKFLNKNHLMGSIKAKHLALYFEDKIVAILSYKVYKKDLKIERFCSIVNHTVIGGFGKFLKYLEKNLSFKRILYWTDLRYGSGKYLENFGFTLDHESLGWKWTDSINTYNRLACRANMDNRRLSEKEYAEELGWYKIYDAGQRLYIKEF